MAFTESVTGLLERVEKFVAGHLETNWVAEPRPSRLALLAREELRRWTQSSYPGSSCEGTALDAGSRRRLSLTIHSAPVTHRVEVWGVPEGQAPLGLGAHTAHSWVLLAGNHEPTTAFNWIADELKKAGLRQVDRRDGPGFTLSLWMGATAPNGCPECLGKK